MSSDKHNPLHDNENPQQPKEAKLKYDSQFQNGVSQQLRIQFDGTSAIDFRTSQTFHQNGYFNFDARIPQGTLCEGHYAIVWCVTPTCRSDILFDDLIFEVEVVSMKHKLWAKVSRDEIQSMRTTNTSGHLRLRLQQHLHICHDSKIFARVSGRIYTIPDDMQTEQIQESHFQVHYMELIQLGERLDIDHDYNVKAPGQILQQIDVRMFAPTAHIIAVDVSASGEYIAILSADKYNAYVAIWDMDAVLGSPPAQINKEHNPYQHSFIGSEPIASTTISLQRFDRIIIHRVRIAISSDGLRVVLYHQPHDDDLAQPDATRKSSPFPFIYIQVKDTYVTAKDLHNTTHVRTMEMTEDITIHCPNNQFIGFGKFMSSDSFGTNSEVSGDADTPKVEYFVACDQSRIAVYDVDNGWKPLYGIAIGGLYSMKSRVDQLRILHQNLQGPSFVWMEDLQNVSIWDIVSGTNLRYISVHNPHSQSQDEIEYIAVSPGGKLMALAGKDWIRTYFMDSGIEIGTKVIDDGTVLDIKFLDCNNGLVVTIRNPSMDQISIILDAMNLSSWNSSPSVFHSSSYSIQHIARPSQATMEAHVIGGVMMTVNHNVLEMFAIPQPGVSIPGGPLIGCRDNCATMKYQGLDSYIHHHPVSHSQYYLAVGFEERESGNQRYKLACVRLHSVDKQGQKHDIITIVPEPWRMLDVDEEGADVEASFIDRWPQFIVITPMGFQVWNLPSISTDNRCEMALSWVTPSTDSAVVSDEVYSYAEKIQDTRVCVHGESVRTTWFDIRKAMNMSECIRIPKRNWITKTETRHCIESIPVLASCYTESSVSAKEAIVRYIVKHINHDPPEGTLDDSVMAKIARSARLECCYDILDAVLRSTDGQWIPRCSSISLGKPRTRVPANPIMLLVKDAKNVPLGLPMAERLIDYCIRQAKSQCDPAFVLPVLLCLRKVVLHHSDIAIDITRRMAFIPVKNQGFVINRAIVARPMWMSVLDTMKRKRTAIYEDPKPIFQLRSQLPRINSQDISRHIEVSQGMDVDPMNESFKGQVYVAPYSILWQYAGDQVLIRSNTNLSVNPSYAEMIPAAVRRALSLYGGRTVRANFSDLDYFDNPAVEALIQHKWNSVVWKTWMVKRVFLVIYFTLVLTVTTMQVYPIMRIEDLQGYLCAIIPMGFFFLYLEFRQFLTDKWLYITSPYNLVDVIVFVLAPLGCVQLLVSISKYENTDAPGYSRALSYVITGIYIQLFSELRVIKSVCTFTTIFWHIAYEVRIILGILLAFVLGSAQTGIHLVYAVNHDCLSIDKNGNQVSGPWSCPKPDTQFPDDFWGAVTAVFFAMGGRYSHLATEYNGAPGADNGVLRFSTMTYYIVISITMVSLLVTIMNVAIVKAAFYGPLAWLSHRFCAVTSAERLSVTAWRFREQSDLFPQYVYYKVPESEAEEFEKRYPSSNIRGKTLSLSMDGCNYIKDRAPALEVPKPTASRGSGKVLQKPQGQENTIPDRISVDTRSKVDSPLSSDDRAGVVDWPGAIGIIGPHSGSVDNDDDDSGCNDTGDDQSNGMPRQQRKLREALHIAQDTVKGRGVKMDRMTELLVQHQQELQLERQQLDQLQRLLLTQRGLPHVTG
ncbi:MAG: hypothetical protein J3Q66DRAFT_424688 [Benniella sp.]|nr:MAG: hypothetical protein J3Q66DRAFT_424688 [Benniella sp.]